MTQSPYGQSSASPDPQFASVPPQYPGSTSDPLSAQFPSAPQYPGPDATGLPGYPNQFGYPAPGTATYDPPRPAKKSPALGIVGMGIVVVAGAIFFMLSYGFMATLFEALGPDLYRYTASGGVPDLSSLPDTVVNQISTTTLGLMGITIVGIVGWVLSIVATAQNKGRTFGIIGIILGVLAPLSFILAAQLAVANFGF